MDIDLQAVTGSFPLLALAHSPEDFILHEDQLVDVAEEVHLIWGDKLLGLLPPSPPRLVILGAAKEPGRGGRSMRKRASKQENSREQNGGGRREMLRHGESGKGGRGGGR